MASRNDGNKPVFMFCHLTPNIDPSYRNDHIFLFVFNDDKGLFINDVIFFRGGYLPPLPPSSFKITFWLTPPPPLVMKNHFLPTPPSRPRHNITKK